VSKKDHSLLVELEHRENYLMNTLMLQGKRSFKTD